MNLNIVQAAAGSDSGLLPLLLGLALLIAAAKLMGGLSANLGQPAVLGELLAGLLMGPTFINILGLPILESANLGSVIHDLGQVGVLLLMFAAGLEIELSDMRRAGRPAILAGVLGVATPLIMGAGLGLAFKQSVQDALFLGITLSATSVSISAQTLLELGRLRSREGAALLGAAVIDDVLVIMALSVLVVLSQGAGGGAGLLLQLGRMVLMLVVVGVLAVKLLPKLANWSLRLCASEGLLAMVLSAVLLLSWAMEFMGGVAAITGAFLAGIGLGRSHLREEILAGLHRLAYAFFVPLFLVDIGLQSNLRLLGGEWLLTGLVLIVAIVSKLFGSGLGARMGGFPADASLRMGMGMISRGEVGLIVAGVGVSEGFLQPEAFTMIVLMVLVTTLITPLLLRWSYGRKEV